MTTYATRSPLQLVTNTHYMMGDRRSTRRTSARLMEKLDAQDVNGAGHSVETIKANGSSTRAVKQAGETSGKSKRKPDYDEEDDGFLFSRTRSKRKRTSQATNVPDPIVEETAPAKSLPTRKSRKKSAEPSSLSITDNVEVAPRRRSTRNSGDKTTVAVSELEVPKRRPKEPPATKKPKERKRRSEVDDDDRMDLVGAQTTPVHNLEISTDTTKIALPFADTPIIRRNKEMRKGERRSSLGLRGRRASSLIDSGTSNALPHSEVESSEFYKHIEASLPEPRRMRQLITWCGTRALGKKPSFATEDSHAKLAAREIQQQLLKDFSNQPGLSDWFNRDEGSSAHQNLRPNPRNTANTSKIDELEKQLAKLQSERQTLENLLNPQVDPCSATPLPQETPSHEEVDISSLSGTDHQALSSFNGVSTSTTQPVSLQANIRARLNAITSLAEFETDKLADSVHILSQHIQGSEKVASGVLAASVKVLEERDREAARRQDGENVGTRDVLRALSRAVER